MFLRFGHLGDRVDCIVEIRLPTAETAVIRVSQATGFGLKMRRLHYANAC